jgi:N-acetylmuramoyl-L-alanine amidase
MNAPDPEDTYPTEPEDSSPSGESESTASDLPMEGDVLTGNSPAEPDAPVFSPLSAPVEASQPPSDQHANPDRPVGPEPASQKKRAGNSRVVSASTAVHSRPRDPAQFNVFYAVQTVISISIIIATLLTLWTPSNLFSDQLLTNMLQAVQNQENPTAIPNFPTMTAPPKPRIGIVAGHWGNDSGSVCSDGLTEEKVNLRIATLVQQYLVSEGYQVDLLQEFDNRLKLYQAMALVSIHNDSCDYINDSATGFKVAAAVSNIYPEKSKRLNACLIDRYGSITGLPFHANTITPDMTSYHAFQEINTNTTAAIIETGFLNLDRAILTEKPDLVARGVTAGILCFVRNEPVKQTEDTTQPPQ